MAKRQRNYKAEYARRIAKAKAAGKTRQEARGHKPREHVERARRSAAKYGASPSTMTRLRREAKDKLKALYLKVARNRVNEHTIARGMKYLHADDLRALIERDDFEIIGKASIQATYLDQLAEDFPVSIDEIEGAEHNPYWYH